MKNKKRTYLISITTAFLIISILGGFLLYKFSKSEIEELKNPQSTKYYYISNQKEPIKISIPENATTEDIINLLKSNGTLEGETAFKILAIYKDLNSNIIPGDIELEGGKRYSFNELINNYLIIKRREKHNFQIAENIRRIDQLYPLIEEKFQFSETDIDKYLKESTFLSDNGLTTETLPSLFIPNTYEFYSNSTVEEFFKKIQEFNNDFWNNERLRKKDSLGFSIIEISILASIVEEEQKRKDIEDRRRIAGVYINRLNNSRDYPYLQADPTVKFANDNFEIKQVLDKHTSIDHPYNTYKKKGLPPGPICIPSIHAIDAVLNAENHNYTFMCAGTDGKHKFSSSNKEHNKHKNRYKKHEGFK